MDGGGAWRAAAGGAVRLQSLVVAERSDAGRQYRGTLGPRTVEAAGHGAGRAVRLPPPGASRRPRHRSDRARTAHCAAGLRRIRDGGLRRDRQARVVTMDRVDRDGVIRALLAAHLSVLGGETVL